jgi:hypothetical protein
MSPTLHVRVLEIRTPSRGTMINKLLVKGGMTSSGKSERHSVVAHRFLRCESCWTFSLPQPEDDELNLTLERRNLFSANETLASCSLPISWFPVDRVVRDWFPMTEASGRTEEAPRTMILLDVHLDSRKAKQFRAGFAPLKFIATWKRPINEFTECPAIAQILVVVPMPQGPQVPYGAPPSQRGPFGPELTYPSTPAYSNPPGSGFPPPAYPSVPDLCLAGDPDVPAVEG